MGTSEHKPATVGYHSASRGQSEIECQPAGCTSSERAAVTWFMYLYLVNQQPDLSTVLALVLAVQGMVAVGQFLVQHDLGRAMFGESKLDRGAWRQRAVGWQPALAAGLRPTGHPNALGATATVLLLLLLPRPAGELPEAISSCSVAATLGLIGLLLSFSRGLARLRSRPGLSGNRNAPIP